jgi:hypothetical protein
MGDMDENGLATEFTSHAQREGSLWWNQMQNLARGAYTDVNFKNPHHDKVHGVFE